MTQDEFEEKLAKLVYRFVNNNEDEDLGECETLEYDFTYTNNKIDFSGTISFDYATTKRLKKEGYL